MSFPDAEYAFRPSLPREASDPISRKRKSVSWGDYTAEAPSRVPNLFLQKVVPAPADVPARDGLYRLVEEPSIRAASRPYPAPALKKAAPSDRSEELRDRKYKLILKTAVNSSSSTFFRSLRNPYSQFW